MIGRIIGFSLYYGLGVGSAVLAMVTVLPSVKLSSADGPAADPAIRHAVMVEGTHGDPALAIAEATARCPYLAAAARGGCPYLAAVAARSGCPAPGGPAGGTGCPYLDRRQGVDGGAPPSTGTPATPEGAAPGPAHPQAEWLPEGTVLAFGPAPAGDELL